MRYMTKKFIIAWVVLGFICGALLFTVYANEKAEFLKGKYGHKCYMRGSEHGNIEYPIFFESVDDCLKSIKEYQDVNLHVERI